MITSTVLWYGVLASITAAYVVALWGVRSARRQDVKRHSRRMMAASTIVGLWLIGYVTKQILFGGSASGERLNNTGPGMCRCFPCTRGSQSSPSAWACTTSLSD